MPYIVSTLTTAQTYIDWDRAAAKRPGAIPLPRTSVTIKGGSNLPTKQLVTPTGGVVTRISSDTAEWLQGCRVFKQHEARGFVKLLDDESEQGAAFEGMEAKDASAPLTNADFAPPGADGQQAPSFVPQKGKEDTSTPFRSISTPEAPTQSRVEKGLQQTEDVDPGLANRIDAPPSPEAPSSQAETLLAEAMATGQDGSSIENVVVENDLDAPPGTVSGIEPTPSQNSEGGPITDADVEGPRRRPRRGIDPEE